MFALQLLPELMIQRLAGVLVHFVWQGTVIVLLLALTIHLGRVRRPTTRYACSLLALLIMAVCPVITYCYVQPRAVAQFDTMRGGTAQLLVPNSALIVDTIPNERPASAIALATEVTRPELGEIEPHLVRTGELSARPTGVLLQSKTFIQNLIGVIHALWQTTQPWIVLGWLAGVGLLSLRLLLGWGGVWRLRRRVDPVPDWVVQRVQLLAAPLGVVIPLVKLSRCITEAIAVGFLKPMILLPVAWVTELPLDMLDAVIAHELAHIRRGDLWINLLQRLVETLLFYHPAVWWLSRRMRIERELCCDELVVEVTRNRLRYAETLEHIGRLSLGGASASLAVSITGPRAVLLDRIRHILNLQPRDRVLNVWLAGVLPLLITGLIWWLGNEPIMMLKSPGQAAQAGQAAKNTSGVPPTVNDLDTQPSVGANGTRGEEPQANPDRAPRLPLEVAAGTEQHIIVRGRVVDDESDQPIDEVAWVGGMLDPKNPGHVSWGYSYQAYDNLRGEPFEKWLNWLHGDRMRVLAPGYQPQSILEKLPEPLPADRIVNVTIRLKRGRVVTGVVKDHAGNPVKNAKVFYVPENHRSNITEGIAGANDYEPRDPTLSHRDKAVMEVVTDGAGKFAIPTETVWRNGRLAVSTPEVDLCPFDIPTDERPVELKLPAPTTVEVDWSFWYLDQPAKDKINPWQTDDPRYSVYYVVRLGTDKDDWKGLHYQRPMLVRVPNAATANLSRGVTQEITANESLPALPDGRINRSLSGRTKIVGLPAGYYEISRKRAGQNLITHRIQVVAGQVTKLEEKRSRGAAVIGTAVLPANSVFTRQENEASKPLTWDLVHYAILTIVAANGNAEGVQLDATKLGPRGEFSFPMHLPPGEYRAGLRAYLPESDIRMKFRGYIFPELDASFPFTVPQDDSTPVVISIPVESRTSRISPIAKADVKVGGNPEVEPDEKAVDGDQAAPPAKPPIESKLGPDRFEGTVRDDLKRSISGADVVLCMVQTIEGRNESEVIAVGRADANGRYSLTIPEDVRPLWQPTTQGVVWAMAKGFGPGVVQFALGNQIAKTPESREEPSEDDDDAFVLEDPFVLYRDRTVAVELVDEMGRPLQGHASRLELEGQPVPSVFVDRMITGPIRGGKLEIKHMPSGHAEVSPVCRSLSVQTASHGLLEFTWNADSSSEREGRIREGAQPVNLTATAASRVTGRLVPSAGELPKDLIANVEIELATFHGEPSMKTPWCSGKAVVKTDAAGRFDIPWVASGKLFRVRAKLPTGAHWRPLVQSDGIVLKPGETKQLDIPLVATRTLRGIVQRPTGEGVPAVEFHVSFGGLAPMDQQDQKTRTSFAYRESILTDSAGKFSVEVIPGDIEVTKQFSPGANMGTPQLWPVSDRFPEWQAGNVLRLPAGDKPFDLPPLEVTSYQGLLQDESGKPVQAVLFVKSANQAGSGYTNTNADGTFVVEVLGKPSTWIAARDKEQGDFGLPRKEAPQAVVISESPLVLQIQPK